MSWREDEPDFPAYVATLPNVIADCVARHGEREFLVSPTRRLTYAQTEAESRQWARGLLAAGVGKGTRVGILMPNGPDWVVGWWAAARTGAFTVALSTFFQPRELAWALREADIDTLLVCDRFMNNDYLQRLEAAIPELASQTRPQLALRSHPYLRRIVVWGDGERPWALRGPAGLVALAEADPRFDDDFVREVERRVAPSDDLIGICTSGSTAEPKIVVHTHGNVVRYTHAYRRYIRLQAEDRNYSGMPLFWVGGLNVNLMQVAYEGAAMVFAASVRPDDVVTAIETEHVTRISMWPAQLASLAECAQARGTDLPTVRRGFRAPADEDGKAIPADRRITSLMGMTESFGAHGAARFEEVLPEGKGRSWGYAIKGIDRKIVDPQTGLDVPAGTVGELHIRGFSMMRGYYRREWGDVFQPDAFFATGDLCSIDADGYIWFVGRNADMIKTSGANVAPREIEALLESYPEVREAIVLGVPDALKGESIHAVVVPREGTPVDAQALLGRLRGDISAYKVPGHIDVLAYESVPRTASGKPLRNALKRLLKLVP